MERHNFLITKADTSGRIVGAQCVRCGKIALHAQNGAVSQALSEEECRCEDAIQAAVRIVREATKNSLPKEMHHRGAVSKKKRVATCFETSSSVKSTNVQS
jgi:hypothetical protein